MRLLADENVPGIAVSSLRNRGHDVLWIRTEAPGSSDRDVLVLAGREESITLTFDKEPMAKQKFERTKPHLNVGTIEDFGELVFQTRLPANPGVILLRLRAPDAIAMATLIVNPLEARSDWLGQFSVIDNETIRMTPLPAAN